MYTHSCQFRESKLQRLPQAAGRVILDISISAPLRLYPLRSMRNLQSLMSSSPELDVQLPTPRETPQPEGHPATPLISDTLFDHPEVFLESSDSTPGRTFTAPSGNPMLTAVDQSGVFDMEVVFCVCSDKDS
jgi:hypothetical protein